MALPWLTYQGTDLRRAPSGAAYVYTTGHMEIDADGAPNAYHPNDTGLDFLANAGFPDHGWRSVLVEDPSHPGTPFRQPDGPFAGFFVSKTSLESSQVEVTDPARYVSATSTPYIVFPSTFHALQGTGTLGDFVLAKNLANGRTTAAIVADIGPANAPLGEVSIKLVEALGGHNPNPRTGSGKPAGTFRYVVFPHSHVTPKWPLTAAQIDEQATQLLATAGGWATFDALH